MTIQERIKKAEYEAKRYGITISTYAECLEELNQHDEIAELLLGSKEEVIEDARERGYFLVEE